MTKKNIRFCYFSHSCISIFFFLIFLDEPKIHKQQTAVLSWSLSLTEQTFHSNEQKLYTGKKNTVTHSAVKHTQTHTPNNTWTPTVSYFSLTYTQTLSSLLAYLLSRSGMVRFLLMKHIFRLMTFLSLEEGELLCLGDPESSLPL